MATTSVEKRAAVGWRVRVFWESEDEWFEGVVTEYAPERGYFVEYDDGEQQWEAEDPVGIQFLQKADGAVVPDATTQVMLDAEEQDDKEQQQQQQQADKWSAQPPPSTTGYEDEEDGYEQEDYEDDHDDPDEQRANGATSPTPEQDDGNGRDGARAPSDRKVSSHIAAAAGRPMRDPTKYVKSGVFFRDPEALKETKTTLLKEKQELEKQYELLASRLVEKEQLSQTVKRELHGLKAQVTVASLKGPIESSSDKKIPRSATDWADRVVAQKTANRATRQQLSVLQSQLTQKQSMMQQMDKQKQQVEAKLARVPRKELCLLVEIQMEIAQMTAEKRDLEAQLAKIMSAERGTSTRKSASSALSSSTTASQDQRDAKTELETELRQIEKQLVRARDDLDEWKLTYDKENAKIVPLRARIGSLQTELQTYESSQVLLRSVFLRLDRKGVGTIALDAALEALTLLAPHDAGAMTPQPMRSRLAKPVPASLDFASFAQCFQQLFA